MRVTLSSSLLTVRRRRESRRTDIVMPTTTSAIKKLDQTIYFLWSHCMHCTGGTGSAWKEAMYMWPTAGTSSSVTQQKNMEDVLDGSGDIWADITSYLAHYLNGCTGAGEGRCSPARGRRRGAVGDIRGQIEVGSCHVR